MPLVPQPQWAQVDLSGVRVERVREFGQVYLGLSLWRRLGLHKLLREIIQPGQEEVPWELTACILSLARFCGQRSELEVAERWYADSVLEDLLGEYAGTLLLVSHDREFLNNVVTSTLVLGGDGSVREFVGGYDDWLQQAAGATAAALVAERDAPEKIRPQKERPRKLSFKEERELEALPERIASLEEEQGQLHTRLSDPEFYKSAGTEIASINARLAALETELAMTYQRWEELEGLRG